MRDLGTLPNSIESNAYGVNAAGQVVGVSFFATGPRAVRWDPVTGMHDLGDLPGGRNESIASDINARGEVAGYSYSSEGLRIVVWNPSNEMQDLGQGIGAGINDAGQVVGGSNNGAFLWDPLSGIQELGVLVGYGPSVLANAIKNVGQVVGFGVSSGTPGERGFVWDSPNGMQQLDLLIDPTLGWTILSGITVNDLGQIAAWGHHATGAQHALLLTPIAVAEPGAFVLLGLGLAALGLFAPRVRG
jgi:probable HAF family extracellular repeat protein